MKDFAELRTAVIWKSASSSIRICGMEKSHIQNTIISLYDKQEACTRLGLGTYEYEGRSALEWINLLRKELDFRNRVKSRENIEDISITL